MRFKKFSVLTLWLCDLFDVLRIIPATTSPPRCIVNSLKALLNPVDSGVALVAWPWPPLPPLDATRPYRQREADLARHISVLRRDSRRAFIYISLAKRAEDIYSQCLILE